MINFYPEQFGRSSSTALTTTTATAVLTGTATIRIRTLYLVNHSGASVNVTLYRGGTSNANIFYPTQELAATSVLTLGGGDVIYLNPGDVLYAQASGANAVNVFIDYELLA